MVRFCGVVPRWTKHPKPPRRPITACRNTSHQPDLPRPFERRRCLVPADAVCAWPGQTPPRHPSRSPGAAGGRVRSPADGKARARRRVDPAALRGDHHGSDRTLLPIHHGMPVIVVPEDIGTSSGKDPDAAAALMRAMPCESACPIGRPGFRAATQSTPVRPSCSRSGGGFPGMIRRGCRAVEEPDIVISIRDDKEHLR